MNVLKIETPQIVGLHRHRTELWHNKAPAVTRGGILGLIEKNHLCNRLNQDRNDLIEDIDQAIAIDAGPFPAHCPMHSETPGMIIDRLSILVLKIYHMAELAESVDTDESQRARCTAMLATLEEQHRDLAAALDALFAEIQAGTRGFRVFRHCKQYNDPVLNPELKAARAKEG